MRTTASLTSLNAAGMAMTGKDIQGADKIKPNEKYYILIRFCRVFFLTAVQIMTKMT